MSPRFGDIVQNNLAKLDKALADLFAMEVMVGRMARWLDSILVQNNTWFGCLVGKVVPDCFPVVRVELYHFDAHAEILDMQ